MHYDQRVRTHSLFLVFATVAAVLPAWYSSRSLLWMPDHHAAWQQSQQKQQEPKQQQRNSFWTRSSNK
jgi:hypothetical protein